MKLPILCFAIALLSLSTRVEAAPPLPEMATLTVDMKMKHYDVAGNTERNIRLKTNDVRPFPFDAKTVWNVNWKYNYAFEGHEYWITNVTIEVTVETTMPRLIRNATQSKTLQNKWDTYIDALQDHEHGHSRIALDAAREMLLQLQRRSISAASAAELEKKIQAKGEEIIGQYRRVELEYDRETQHGLKGLDPFG
ncbi:MAG: putative secreted Zn-dependent protease [Pirellulaceae bacterium]|jgi:predicted secreted Zn-dependent protease